MVEDLPSVPETLGLVLNTAKNQSVQQTWAF